MLKAKAIELLGGSTASAAKEIGISYQAVDKWPEDLPPRIADRVLAAVARKHMPPSIAEALAEEAKPAANPAEKPTAPVRIVTQQQQKRARPMATPDDDTDLSQSIDNSCKG